MVRNRNALLVLAVVPQCARLEDRHSRPHGERSLNVRGVRGGAVRVADSEDACNMCVKLFG